MVTGVDEAVCVLGLFNIDALWQNTCMRILGIIHWFIYVLAISRAVHVFLLRRTSTSLQ